MMKLYGTPGSGNCHKVRLLLSMLGLEWQEVGIDLPRGEHKEPAFLLLNPLGKVPVIDDDGYVLRDSQAILVYLARKYDERWFPAEARAAGEIMQWLIFAACDIRQGLNMMRRINVAGLSGDLEAARDASAAALDVLESRLAERTWLALEAPTVADLACYPYVAMAPSSGFPIDSYGHVGRWIEGIRALPGYPALPGID